MDDAQLLRYSRHILLDELGPDAQAQFADAHALVVGMGGLGTPAAHFLAAAGVGTITICDADHVDLTNLQRQILYATADVGARKVDAAAQRLVRDQPGVRVERIPERVGAAELGAARRRRRRRARLLRQFRDAPRGESRVRGRAQAAGLRRRDPLRRPDRGVRRARCGVALLPLPVRRRRGARGDALRDDGRVRAAGRHRRRDAGGRGAEAHRGRRRVACGPAAPDRRAGDALARNARAARSRVPRVQRAAR